MAPVQNLYRLVWGGRLFTNEQWSCSLHVNSAAGLNLAASNFSAALVKWMGVGGANLSSAAKLDYIKFNDIAPLTGRYLLPTSNSLEQNDLAVGGNVAGIPQNTVAVSLRTAKERGRAHAGRFYPPSAQMSIEAGTATITATVAGQMVAAAKTLVNDINLVVGAGSSVVVFSKIGQTVEPVTAIRVGRVVDTMRSRRRSLTEDYASAVL